MKVVAFGHIARGTLMKLVRVGEFGREQAAVLGPHGEVLRLPDRFGDIDANFWRQDRIPSGII